MLRTQDRLLPNLIRGSFEVSSEPWFVCETFFEIQLSRRVLAAHQTNNASIAISFGGLRIDLDSAVKIGHGAIEITLLRQQVSAIVIEAWMLFKSYGFVEIGDRLIKTVQPVERNTAEIKAELQTWAMQLDRLSEIGNSAFEIVLFKTADTARCKFIR